MISTADIQALKEKFTVVEGRAGGRFNITLIDNSDRLAEAVFYAQLPAEALERAVAYAKGCGYITEPTPEPAEAPEPKPKAKKARKKAKKGERPTATEAAKAKPEQPTENAPTK